jgi:hypothetical protein
MTRLTLLESVRWLRRGVDSPISTSSSSVAPDGRGRFASREMGRDRQVFEL